MHELNLQLIEKASVFLRGKILKTPLEFCPALSEILKVPVYLKLEFLQRTGSFKVRGGLFYLSTLSERERKQGVAACSAGNHGIAVAYAAKELGVECTIFAPKNIERIKEEKIAKLGVRLAKSDFVGFDDTHEWASDEAAKQGHHLITPYNDERIMASNGGSIALEILEEMPEIQNFIVPVGGGGMCAGIAYYAKAKKPEARIVGCQLASCPTLKLSFETGRAATRMPALETVAAAIEGGLGEKCFEILKSRLTDIALSSEEEVIEAFRWSLKNQQFLIEPSSAVSLAPCLFNKISPLKGPAVVIFSGRNISYSTLQKLIEK